ncbi:MAG: guanylate kinase [Alphaproteobacteria bacterium]|nr:guanylate kinase [Alphaproteobacteria bacterium]
MNRPNSRAASSRGFILVLSSPSGAGKTTLSRALLEANGDFVMSVSATTRPPRATEVDGRDYFFVDDARFDEMVRRGEFLEWAKVFAHRYGTPAAPVHEALANGRCVLFDIDWQGTQQLTQHRDDMVTVFILPPTMADLTDRLRLRAQDTPEVVATRMAKAGAEITHWSEYDYVLVNSDLAACLRQLQTIVEAERLRRQRQTWLVQFVRELLDQGR